MPPRGTNLGCKKDIDCVCDCGRCRAQVGAELKELRRRVEELERALSERGQPARGQ